MFKFKEEEKKGLFPIKYSSQAAGKLPESGKAEWEMCHTREDAIKWHLKWTPWWSKDMIEGIVDKAYLRLLDKKPLTAADINILVAENEARARAIEDEMRIKEAKKAEVKKEKEKL